MKLSLYKNHFLVMQTNYFLQKNKINKIRLPSLTIYLYSVRIFPGAFLQIRARRTLMFRVHICCNASIFGSRFITKTVAMILEVKRCQ